MFLLSVLRYALHLLVPLSLILSSYLYLYPAFHLCAFPTPDTTSTIHSSYLTTLLSHTPFSPSRTKSRVPFRLLALGDPQLEGDSSLDHVESTTFPTWRRFLPDSGLKGGSEHSGMRQRLRHSLHDLIDFYLDDIPNALEVYRKRLDHFGNDYYLGHIYRTLHWWTRPTHVTVLGDLVGSQWIDEEEFDHRGRRFWDRVFKGGVKVPAELYSQPAADFHDTLILGEDAEDWEKRIINVAGNHDIGYAGDISPERMERFTRVFGKPNYEMRFNLPINTSSVPGEEADRPIPELRVVILNDMNLDTPVSSKELQDETYNFLNSIITTSQDVARPAHFTLVLTHIPIFKQAGICVDGPFFSFFDGHFENGVKEQNHLSMDVSKGFLEGIFGMSANPGVAGQGLGRRGVILTGHDHEGCDVFHYINQSAPPEQEWHATTWSRALETGLHQEPQLPHLREITVRSMMGAYGGNAGLMSLWFDEAAWEWRFEFANCQLGKQHLWWAVHVLDLITLGVAIVYAGLVLVEQVRATLKQQGKMGGYGNGKATVPKTETKPTLDESRSRKESDMLLDRGGLMISPEQGKRSLRKKKSKVLMNGETAGRSSVLTKM